MDDSYVIRRQQNGWMAEVLASNGDCRVTFVSEDDEDIRDEKMCEAESLMRLLWTIFPEWTGKRGIAMEMWNEAEEKCPNCSSPRIADLDPRAEANFICSTCGHAWGTPPV